MFCSNCGKEIPNDSSFCSNCGHKLKKSIQESIPPPAKASPLTPLTSPQQALPQQASPQQISPQQTAPQQILPQQASPQQTVPPQILPQQTAPIYPGNPVNLEKKKNKLLIPLIIIGAVVFLAITIYAVLFINKKINERTNNESVRSEERSLIADIKDIINIDDNNNEVSENDDTDDNLVVDNEIPENDLVEDETDEVDVVDDTEILFEPLYNYIELPYVLSIDSDLRFTYVDYYAFSDSSVYTYLFNDVNATEADFYKACEEYSLLLQELSGFTYEADYSEQKYAETGLLTNFLTKDDYAISITASVEDFDYFAYITIYLLTDDVEDNVDDDNVSVEFDMPNYNYFLANRETLTFTYNQDVYMDNGLSFYIYEVMGNYTDDGDVVIDVILDISSYYTDYYFNNGDFFILPLDAEGYILTDAVPVTMVLDEAGNEVTMPFLLSASSYDTYTFYFPVPNETYSLLFYATNVLNDNFSFPVYVMQVGN